MTAAYRLRQGLRALTAFARQVEDNRAAHYLSPPLLALFRRMSRSEQLHSLNVLRALQTSGDVSDALATAALLHDVGKSRYPLRLWQRSLAALTASLAPILLRRWNAGDPESSWARAFVVYIHHPAWSAEMILSAGGSADGAWLAAHHADDADNWREHRLFHELKRLQAADDTN